MVSVKRKETIESSSQNWKRGAVWWSGSPCCLQMWKRCFSWAQFLITRQSGRTHPLLFSVITKQIIAECQGNFQIITGVAEKDVRAYSCRFSFCWWQYISLRSWSLKYTFIRKARAYYSLPWSCRDSIPQSVCWTRLQQWTTCSQWSAAFCPLFTHMSPSQ